MNGTTRLSVFYVVFFLQVGVYLPYWPLWLAAQGLSPAQIGVLLGVTSWLRLIVAPLVGHRADGAGQPKRLIVPFALVASAGFVALGLVDSWLGFVAATLVVGVGMAPLMPLVDSLVLRRAAAGALDYGRVRVWGSVSFVVATALCGNFLEQRPSAWIYRFVLLSAFAIAVAAAYLPEAAPLPARAAERVRLRELLRQAWFARFMLAALLLQTSHAVLMGFASLHWTRVAGISSNTVGWLWAEGVLAEIVVFAFGHRLLAVAGARGALILASVAGLVRWPLLAESAALLPLILAQALHGLSFGAAHLGCMDVIRARVPENRTSFVSSLYTAIVLGVGFGVALPVAGWLYAKFGVKAFWWMLLPSALGGLLSASLGRSKPQPA